MALAVLDVYLAGDDNAVRLVMRTAAGSADDGARDNRLGGRVRRRAGDGAPAPP